MQKNRKKYDTVIVTCLPSFYKINLYNEINKHKSILVIFTGKGSYERNKDFFSGNINFEYKNLKKSNEVNKILSIRKIMSEIKYDELIISGYDEPVLWYLALFFSKEKNSAVVESSIHESQTNGVKGLIKKIFFKRISKVYASGKSQKKLVESLGFQKKIIITKGVGIFNIVQQPKYIARNSITSFIYVGRLSQEKNLKFLIENFNSLPELKLHIVGFGPQEKELKEMAKNNIIFHGAVDNKILSEFYQTSDVFVLPSISEPWGLVVEEALNNGLPILLSDKIGCAKEIINDENGVLFESNNKSSFLKAIEKITQLDFNNKLRFNISKINFDEIKERQVRCYL